MPIKILKSLFIVSTILFSTQSFSKKPPRNQHPLLHDAEKIVVDGLLNESVWAKATKMELAYENNPGDGSPSPVRTEIFFYENGDAFNVAIIAYDPAPEMIRASLRERDTLWSDDNVGIIIDTFNDERGGYEFFVNPLGAQADMRMDDKNGWNEDSSWDAIWESKGRITDFGYVVEMSIPFSSIRFPESDDELIWNVAGWRNYPRDIRTQMATHQSDRDIECNLCQFEQLVGFKHVKSGKNFQVTPTLTVSRQDEKEEVPGEWQEGKVETDPGLDIRWGITQDIVLNATINPDFSQVEADAGQLDVNNTYSLYFPEKRPFFLDGASYFETSNFNFVHTRNIADPDMGLKVTGKSNTHSYGVMVANDNNTTFLIPSNQGSDLAELETESKLAIARYKVDVGDRNSIGVLLTHRNADHYNNTLLSVDGNYWFNQSDSLTYQVARSQTDNPQSVVDDFSLAKQQNDNAYSIDYSHSNRDYSLSAGYTNVGEDFRADLGFQSKVNYEKLIIGGRRNYYGDDNDWFTRWGYFGDWDKSFDQDGTLLEEEFELHANLQGQYQFYTDFGVVQRKSLYDDQYFNETQFMMYAEAVPASGFSIGSFIRFGKQIDFANTQLGDVKVIELSTDWDVNQHVNIEVNYNFNQLDVDKGKLFAAHQSDIRLGYQFNMYSSLKFIMQYTDIKRNVENYLTTEIDDIPDHRTRRFSTQLIYSYKVNPQTLFFVGYSDGGFQDDNLDHLERDQRTVFTKFSYAWQL
ncbi:DUF5916 domain-containing protein [Thalassotalea piscium]